MRNKNIDHCLKIAEQVYVGKAFQIFFVNWYKRNKKFS